VTKKFVTRLPHSLATTTRTKRIHQHSHSFDCMHEYKKYEMQIHLSPIHATIGTYANRNLCPHTIYAENRYLLKHQYSSSLSQPMCGSKLPSRVPIQSNSSMQHYECVALCKDISLQRGRFCARSLALCIPRSSEDRSSWMFFIQVVHGSLGGRLQFSGGGSKMAWLAV